MKKKRIALLLSILMVLLCFPSGFVQADASSSIELVFDRLTGKPGDILVATIKVNNIKNFAGYQVNIKYDQNILKPVDPETGKDYNSNTPLVGEAILTNQKFGTSPLANHDLKQGMLNFANVYINLSGYKNSGVPEESGIIGKIGFKVIQARNTQVTFSETVKMPGADFGIVLFDWNGDVITGYDVIQPGRLDLGFEPSPRITPDNDTTPVPTPVSTLNVTPDKVDVVPELDDAIGEARVTIEADKVKDALDAAESYDGVKYIEFAVEKVEGADAYIVELPKDYLNKSRIEHKIFISTEYGKLEVPSNMMNHPDMLNAIVKGSVIQFVIRNVAKEELSSELRALIGNRPVVDIDIMVDGKKLDWNNPDAQIRVSIPYKPSSQELNNHEHIVVLYINNAGTSVSVPSGRYDTASGSVTFTTNHLSRYAVAYVHKTFTDIGSYGWAKKQIEVLASKGVINGTSDTTYTPGADITRADFMILLVKALGLTASVDSNFDDVSKNDYFYEYVGIAKKLGITSGVGNNKFNPREKITRQDMMVLTTNALKIAGKISGTGTAADVQRFSDKSLIASYAVEGVATLVKEGIVVGSGDIINPRGNASRAELAAIVYKIYYK
jgi:hypothetical protein